MLNADTVVENTVRASAYTHENPDRKIEVLRKSMGRNLVSLSKINLHKLNLIFLLKRDLGNLLLNSLKSSF